MKKRLLPLLMIVMLLLFPVVIYAQTSPNLGATSSFAIFTGNGAFNEYGTSSTVTGDVGTNVGAFNAFPPGTLIDGVKYLPSSPLAVQAATDVAIAYSDLTQAGTAISDILSGQTLIPGVYTTGAASSFVASGVLTLDGEGDPNALFIIRIGGALSTGVSSSVILINSASPRNVYWQVDGAFSLGDNSVFVGTMIAKNAVELLEGSSVIGRVLSREGAISLHNNIVTLFPEDAGTISGTASVCQEQTGVSYSVATINRATDYIWTLPAGASIVSGSNTNSITVDFSAVAVSGNITVQGSNAAGTGAVSPNYAVTVNPLPLTSAVYHH